MLPECYPVERVSSEVEVTRNVTRNTSLTHYTLPGAVLLGYHLFVPARSRCPGKR